MECFRAVKKTCITNFLGIFYSQPFNLQRGVKVPENHQMQQHKKPEPTYQKQATLKALPTFQALLSLTCVQELPQNSLFHMMFCSSSSPWRIRKSAGCSQVQEISFYSTTGSISEAGNPEEEQFQGKMIETISDRRYKRENEYQTNMPRNWKSELE